IRSSRERETSAAWSSARTGWQWASAAIPGLPGAACSSARSPLRERDQASACSRPPDPTTSARTGRSYARRSAHAVTLALMDAPPYSAVAVDVLRLPAGTTEPDRVAVEEPLEIRIAGRPVAVTMRTPGHDEELALGFCL